MYSTRGIRIWSEIACALLTIQLWWCLDRAHHSMFLCYFDHNFAFSSYFVGWGIVSVAMVMTDVFQKN